MSTFEKIFTALTTEFGDSQILRREEEVLQPWIDINPFAIDRVCQFLKDDSRFFFDYLECLSAIDTGPDAGKLGVVYHIMSIPYGHRLVLKTFVDRLDAKLPTVSKIWRTADWHEREAWDLMGIQFEGHEDLRRILMPEDWEGHPLRKDYINPEYYHDIQTAY